MRLLCKRYVTEQLLWLPVGSRIFAKMLQDALQTLRHILFGQQDETLLPQVTDQDIAINLQQTLQEHESAIRQTAIDVLSHEHIPQFPDPQQLQQGPVHFIPTVEATLGQSHLSIQEQRTAMTRLSSAIDNTLPPTSQPGFLHIVRPSRLREDTPASHSKHLCIG